MVDVIASFVFAFVVTFVILVTLFKVCIGKVMKFLGADIYTFDLKKRVKIISIISLVVAILAAIFIPLM